MICSLYHGHLTCNHPSTSINLSTSCTVAVGSIQQEQPSWSVYSLPHECQKCVHCPIHSCELNLCLRTARQGQQRQRMDWVFCITAPFPFLRMKDRSLDSGFVTGLSSSIVPITPSNEIVFASTRQQGPDIKTKRGPTTNR